MIFLLMTGIVLMAQTGTGWSQQRSKVNFKDSINIAKAWMIDGTAITPSAEELNYVNDLTSNAQDQLDAITADIDTLQTDTVDIDDVALALTDYAIMLNDTIQLFVFGGGGGNAGDTAVFTTSTIYGSFFNESRDTLVVTSLRVVMLGEISTCSWLSIYDCILTIIS